MSDLPVGTPLPVQVDIRYLEPPSFNEGRDGHGCVNHAEAELWRLQWHAKHPDRVVLHEEVATDG